MMGDNTTFCKSAISLAKILSATFIIVLLLSCSRKAGSDRLRDTYSEQELHDIRSAFDSCEAVISSFRTRSVNTGNADSILAAVNDILQLPDGALTEEQSAQRARHYVTASSVYIMKNDVVNAFSILDKGLEQYQDMFHRNAYCDISTAMTILFFNYAMYRQADKYANLAIEAAKHLKDSTRLCTAYTNKSWIADRVNGGCKDSAFHYVALARQWRPKDNFILDYVLESYAGHIYVTSPDSAALGISNLLELDKKYSSALSTAEGYSYIPYNLGRGYATLGNDRLACRYFERAIEHAGKEPDMIKNEIYEGILEYYINHNMIEQASEIIPEWFRTSMLRNRTISEQGMAYWDSRFQNTMIEYELQLTRNDLLQNKLKSLILIPLVILSGLAILFLLYRIIHYKRKMSTLYDDLQRSHARWQELTSSHTENNPQDNSTDMISETINLETDDDDEEKLHTMRTIYERVKSVMEKEKPFLSPEFDLSQLALMVYCNRSQLSAAINRFYGANFSNVVSEYRVNNFIEMLDSPDVKIEELWPKAGFPSRSSFYRQFHDITKLTPAQYIEQKLKHRKSKV